MKGDDFTKSTGSFVNDLQELMMLHNVKSLSITGNLTDDYKYDIQDLTVNYFPHTDKVGLDMHIHKPTYDELKDIFRPKEGE